MQFDPNVASYAVLGENYADTKNRDATISTDSEG